MVFGDCIRMIGLQSWPKKFVLGCAIPPAGAVARSLNQDKIFGHLCILFLLILKSQSVKAVFELGCSSFHYSVYRWKKRGQGKRAG